MCFQSEFGKMCASISVSAIPFEQAIASNGPRQHSLGLHIPAAPQKLLLHHLISLRLLHHLICLLLDHHLPVLQSGHQSQTPNK